MSIPANRKDLLFSIRYLGKLLSLDFDKRLSEHGLTCQQGRLLFYINRMETELNQEVHQNDIENEFHLSKSTVSGLIKRMEKRGVVTVSKKHQYAVINVTDEGREILLSVRHARDELSSQLKNEIGEDGYEQLITSLEKLINCMKGEKEDDK